MADNTGNESEHKVWLLSWNPDNWNWDGKYSELCAKCKFGEKRTEAWECQSKQPKINDEIFLIKTGSVPIAIDPDLSVPGAAQHVGAWLVDMQNGIIVGFFLGMKHGALV